MAFEPRYPIDTERLRLRPFNRGDVDAVFAYRQREDVAQHLFDGPMTHETATEVVGLRAGQSTLSGDGDKIFLAVELREPHAMVGEVSLIWRDVANRQSEIGYIFNPVHHGNGYATEAALADPASRTADLGGPLGTDGFAARVCDLLAQRAGD